MNAALIGSIIYNYYYYKNEDDKMTDHKFEGEKVKKALRCCAQPDPICKECPYYDADLKYPCADHLKWAALNVIDRQEAKLEDLLEIVFMDRSEAIKNLKAEAIKEFAERLIKKCDAPHWCVWMSEIEDLKEEMTEEQK
jgi:hypothetical protein